MKNVSFLFLFFLITFQSDAQVSMGFGGGFLRQSGSGSHYLMGGETHIKYQFASDLRVGVNGGFYQRWEDSGGARARSTFAPITASVECLFLENKLRPYAGFNVGVLLKERIFKALGFYDSIHSYVGFYLTPVLGVDYAVFDKIGVNFSIKYGIAFDKQYSPESLVDYRALTSNVGVYFKL